MKLRRHLAKVMLFGCCACAEETMELLDRPEPVVSGGTGALPATGAIGGDASVPLDASSGSGGTAAGAPGISIPSVLDDFSDCDELIPQVDGRSGSWFHFTTPTSEIGSAYLTVGLPPDATWGTQTCGVFLTGSCATCDAVGLGVQLAGGGTYDLTPFVGMRVSFESDGDLWVVVKSERDGVVGYSAYIQVPATGFSSGTREVYWTSMLPGDGFHGFASATEIQFTVGEAKRSQFGLGLHRVELF